MQNTSKNIRLLTLNNKLIAEFMGKDHELNQCISAPQYHKEWNWLMPVVEKMQKIVMEDSTDELYNSEQWDNVTHFLVQINIESTYKAVVEFIKWYNEQDRFICGVCGDHVNEYTYNKDKDVDECNNCK